MKQLVYVKKRTLRWQETPDAVLQGPAEAIVRPFVAARCDGDVVPLFNDAAAPLRLGVALHQLDPLLLDVFGAHPFKGPIAFGHECVAEVLECGAEVRDVTPGDTVIVPWSVSCGACFNCRHGLTSRCSRGGGEVASGYGFGVALGPWGGMVCDRVRVPFADAMLVKLPPAVDPLTAASASDNLPDAWRAVGPVLARFPGAPVLVVGGAAKSIGLYAAGMAVALGSTQVDYVDSSRDRLDLAQRLGAHPIEARGAGALRRLAPRRGGPYLASVEATSSGAGLALALRSLAPGGTCTGVGYYFRKGTPVPAWAMYMTCATLQLGLSHPRADLPHVLGLLQKGSFAPGMVTTLLADWEDAPRAFLERTTKVVVRRARSLTHTRAAPQTGTT